MNGCVLITGAYGFIGRYVARLYSSVGCQVIGLGHGKWKDNEEHVWGINEWHETDITIDSLYSYAGDCYAIIHCAGGSSVEHSVSHPRTDFVNTVNSTYNVLEFIRSYSKKTKLVYLSSAAVYGFQTSLPLTPKMWANPVSPYGVHKKIAEEICIMYAVQYSVSCIILRLFSVYGRGLRKQLLWDACNKISQGRNFFWGTGDETRDFLHVKDVAQVIYMSTGHTSDKCPIFNVASGKSISIKEILKEVFSCFDKKESPFFNAKQQNGNPPHYQADITDVMTWGWKPTIGLKCGIADYVRWYKGID